MNVPLYLEELPSEITTHIWRQCFALHGVTTYEAASALAAVACTCHRFYNEVQALVQELDIGHVNAVGLTRILLDPAYVRHVQVNHVPVMTTFADSTNFTDNGTWNYDVPVPIYWCPVAQQWYWKEGEKQDMDLHIVTESLLHSGSRKCWCYFTTPLTQLVLTRSSPGPPLDVLHVTYCTSMSRRLIDLGTNALFTIPYLLEWYAANDEHVLLQLENGHLYSENIDLRHCTRIQKVEKEYDSDMKRRVKLMKNLQSFVFTTDVETLHRLETMIIA